MVSAKAKKIVECAKLLGDSSAGDFIFGLAREYDDNQQKIADLKTALDKIYEILDSTGLYIMQPYYEALSDH